MSSDQQINQSLPRSRLGKADARARFQTSYADSIPVIRSEFSQVIDGLEEDPASNIPLLSGKAGIAEKSTASTLRNKLFQLGRSDMLDWGPTGGTPYLDVDELLVKQRLSVFDVSETNDTARNIAIAFFLQALFDRVVDAPRGSPLRSGGPPATSRPSG